MQVHRASITPLSTAVWSTVGSKSIDASGVEEDPFQPWTLWATGTVTCMTSSKWKELCGTGNWVKESFAPGLAPIDLMVAETFSNSIPQKGSP